MWFSPIVAYLFGVADVRQLASVDDDDAEKCELQRQMRNQSTA